ncbi:Chromosomal replication initiator protein DnaA [Gammaproteobacteria bacterium]
MNPYIYPGIIDIKTLSIKNNISIEKIEQTIITHYNITLNDLYSKSRVKIYKEPRQICMYLIRKFVLGMTYDKIAKHYNKNHATVIWACKRIKGYLEVDKEFIKDYKILESKLIDL